MQMISKNRALRCAGITVLFLCVLGCAGLPKGNQNEKTPPPAEDISSIPIPVELQEKVGLSEALGWELYITDKMAIIGTDVMLEKLDDSQKARICGYIVIREGDDHDQPPGSWLVEFLVDRSDPKVGYKVHITPPADPPGKATTKFEEVTPPGKPSESELVLHRAIRTSLEAIPDRPNQPANPVVMPGAAIGKSGLLVYLLAGTKKDRTVVFGKHYRVLVSEDGRSATGIEPLTKAALEIPIPPAGPDGEKPFLCITHLLGDSPLETHVFISRLHHKTLYVNTEKYIWRIDEGRISLVNLRRAALHEAKTAYKKDDYHTAYKKLKFLAVQGDTNAQCGLGALYESGKGVAKDYAEAAKWYGRAAEWGNPVGQCNLGGMYMEGRGVSQDFSKAFDLFSEAAEHGYLIAQCNLGAMHAEGKGVARDYIKAYMWCSLAAGQGDSNAQKNLDLMAKKMSSSEIAEAQRLAKEWKPKND